MNTRDVTVSDRQTADELIISVTLPEKYTTAESLNSFIFLVFSIFPATHQLNLTDKYIVKIQPRFQISDC